MRRLSLAIIAFAVMLIGIFSMYPKGYMNKSNRKIPPHGENFTISCSVCHSSNGWKIDKEIYSFNHDSTEMPLIGQHAQVDCKLCHPTLIFSEAKTQCAQCHNDMHESTVGKECSRCHTPHSWLVNNITQIHQQSRFPLVGVHSKVACFQCHTSETFFRYDVIGTECYSCHNDNYAATTQPNHASAGYSTNCTDCHTIFSDSWVGSGFNHDFFALTQGHALPNCSACHKGGNTTKLSPVCVNCHQPDYNATTNPNHLSAHFSTDCKMCHTTAPGWKPANFDHAIFPLTQGHNINDCSKCHVNGNYSNTSNVCVSCHQSNFNATTNPNHVSSNFSTDCKMCHSTAPGWKPATFDHSKFPLTQGHNINDCSKCHVNGNYSNTSNVCVNCHQADYNSSTNPNHVNAKFSTDCKICHTTAPGWKPAKFDHSKFPLTQGHNITDCNKCHINGNYSNTSPDCKSCHQTDYNATTNPSHITLNFSTTCTQCHTTAPGWKPASYTQHDALSFPIYSGKHKGQWNTCTECHSNPASYKVFSCIDCHEHNKSDMDNKHKDVKNYLYTSASCLNCHPKGSTK